MTAPFAVIRLLVFSLCFVCIAELVHGQAFTSSFTPEQQTKAPTTGLSGKPFKVVFKSTYTGTSTLPASLQTDIAASLSLPPSDSYRVYVYNAKLDTTATPSMWKADVLFTTQFMAASPVTDNLTTSFGTIVGSSSSSIWTQPFVSTNVAAYSATTSSSGIYATYDTIYLNWCTVDKNYGTTCTELSSDPFVITTLSVSLAGAVVILSLCSCGCFMYLFNSYEESSKLRHKKKVIRQATKRNLLAGLSQQEEEADVAPNLEFKASMNIIDQDSDEEDNYNVQ